MADVKPWTALLVQAEGVVFADRKLSQEIHQALRKTRDGLNVFEELWGEGSGPHDKDKIAELKQQLGKLQRLRETMRGWIANGDVKEKNILAEATGYVENEMSRFKILEKEAKIKPYAKEALAQEDKLDPYQAAKLETTKWIQDCTGKLVVLKETLEGDIEALECGAKKNGQADHLGGLQKRLEQVTYHEVQMEKILRLLENEQVAPEQVEGLKDNMLYFLEACEEGDFSECGDMYEGLPLSDVPDSVGCLRPHERPVDPASPTEVLEAPAEPIVTKPAKTGGKSARAAKRAERAACKAAPPALIQPIRALRRIPEDAAILEPLTARKEGENAGGAEKPMVKSYAACLSGAPDAVIKKAHDGAASADAPPPVPDVPVTYASIVGPVPAAPCVLPALTTSGPPPGSPPSVLGRAQASLVTSPTVVAVGGSARGPLARGHPGDAWQVVDASLEVSEARLSPSGVLEKVPLYAPVAGHNNALQPGVALPAPLAPIAIFNVDNHTLVNVDPHPRGPVLPRGPVVLPLPPVAASGVMTSPPPGLTPPLGVVNPVEEQPPCDPRRSQEFPALGSHLGNPSVSFASKPGAAQVDGPHLGISVRVSACPVERAGELTTLPEGGVDGAVSGLNKQDGAEHTIVDSNPKQLFFGLQDSFQVPAKAWTPWNLESLVPTVNLEVSLGAQHSPVPANTKTSSPPCALPSSLTPRKDVDNTENRPALPRICFTMHPVDDYDREYTPFTKEASSVPSVEQLPPANPPEAAIKIPDSFPKPEDVPHPVRTGDVLFYSDKTNPCQAAVFAFYYQQGTVQQLIAASKLKQQGWSFHTELKKWYRPVNPNTRVTKDFEEGQFLYFDAFSLTVEPRPRHPRRKLFQREPRPGAATDMWTGVKMTGPHFAFNNKYRGP